MPSLLAAPFSGVIRAYHHHEAKQRKRRATRVKVREWLVDLNSTEEDMWVDQDILAEFNTALSTSTAAGLTLQTTNLSVSTSRGGTAAALPSPGLLSPTLDMKEPLSPTLSSRSDRSIFSRGSSRIMAAIGPRRSHGGLRPSTANNPVETDVLMARCC